jgi:hypothetical protein
MGLNDDHAANNAPLIRIEYIPPVTDYELCTTCAMLYLGEVSMLPEVRREARELVEEGIKNGKSVVYLKLPRVEFRPLRIALTVGPSVYFPMPYPPMPVCWVHLQGYNPERPKEERSLNENVEAPPPFRKKRGMK